MRATKDEYGQLFLALAAQSPCKSRRPPGVSGALGQGPIATGDGRRRKPRQATQLQEAPGISAGQGWGPIVTGDGRLRKPRLATDTSDSAADAAAFQKARLPQRHHCAAASPPRPWPRVPPGASSGTGARPDRCATSRGCHSRTGTSTSQEPLDTRTGDRSAHRQRLALFGGRTCRKIGGWGASTGSTPAPS